MPTASPELWWAFLVGTAVFLMLGVGIIGTVIFSQRRFIRTQKDKVRALAKSQKQYQDLFDNVPDIIYIHSLNGILQRVNPAVTKLLGYEEHELLGKSIADLIDPKYQTRFHRYLREIRRNERVSGLMRLTSKHGEECVFEYRNSVIKKNDDPVAVRGIARDVTKQKWAEQALRESEERFRRLVNYSPVPMAVHSRGIWIYANDAAKRLLKSERKEDIVGKSILHFVPRQQRHALLSRLRQQQLSQEDVSILEEKIERLDGQVIEVEIVAIPINYGGQQAGQVVVRDITEQKRLQKELARAQRLETAGRVAGQIAHDFNNLLAPLTAYPTMIRESLSKEHSAWELIDEIESAAKKISEINQQLLALGRRGHYSMEPIDLNELVRKVIAAVPFPEKIVVETDLSPESLVIKGGEAQLTRALTNLIVNAKEAMRGIGVLTITTENIVLHEPITGYKKIVPGRYIKLDIADTGTAIPPKIFDKIFDPFFTTKKMDRMRGSGLGLSIVHGVLEDHDAYISVDSRLGQGTCFSIYFPAFKETIRDSNKSQELQQGNGEKILLVDDDPVQRKVGSRLLDRLGYEVETAASGEEAVQFVKQNPQDLLVLDMVMDGIDGAEAYRQILEFNPKQKAIVLSGYAMSRRVKEALRLGAGGFVAKPVTPKSLAEAIREELSRNSHNGN